MSFAFDGYLAPAGLTASQAAAVVRGHLRSYFVSMVQSDPPPAPKRAYVVAPKGGAYMATLVGWDAYAFNWGGGGGPKPA